MASGTDSVLGVWDRPSEEIREVFLHFRLGPTLRTSGTSSGTTGAEAYFVNLQEADYRPNPPLRASSLPLGNAI